MSRLQGAQRRRTVRPGLDILEATPPFQKQWAAEAAHLLPVEGRGLGRQPHSK